MMNTNVKSQRHGGVEQYYYSGVKNCSFVPKLYYETSNNWYGEIHYNYEQFQTASFNVGKLFENKKTFSYSVTPFAGIVVGKLNGGNLGLNINLGYKKLFFSAESQYTFSFEKRTDNFFFNWSEAWYELTDFLYSGVALQVTQSYGIKNKWQPGIMLGFNYKSFTFPLYIFNPYTHNSNFVLGVNWEWKPSKPEK